MKEYKKPTAKQVVWLLNELLCEFSPSSTCDENCQRYEKHAYIWSHIATGLCRNKHNQARKEFWKQWEDLRKERMKLNMWDGYLK